MSRIHREDHGGWRLATTPDALDDAGAAGLPLVGLIAWQSLIDTAAVTSHDRVLIQAAAGGVGQPRRADHQARRRSTRLPTRISWVRADTPAGK